MNRELKEKRKEMLAIIYPFWLVLYVRFNGSRYFISRFRYIFSSIVNNQRDNWKKLEQVGRSWNKLKEEEREREKVKRDSSHLLSTIRWLSKEEKIKDPFFLYVYFKDMDIVPVEGMSLIEGRIFKVEETAQSSPFNTSCWLTAGQYLSSLVSSFSSSSSSFYSWKKGPPKENEATREEEMHLLMFNRGGEIQLRKNPSLRWWSVWGLE